MEDTMFDLRTALRLDAIASGGLGALLLATAGLLDEPLGLPVGLTLVVGGVLLVWSGLVGWISVGASEPLAKDVVAGNVVWVAASTVFAVSGWVELTGLGVAFVVAQAAAVAGLTCLQVAGLRGQRTSALV
jgi:hypothetical protein